jgi:hypothetical protein
MLFPQLELYYFVGLVIGLACYNGARSLVRWLATSLSSLIPTG